MRRRLWLPLSELSVLRSQFAILRMEWGCVLWSLESGVQSPGNSVRSSRFAGHCRRRCRQLCLICAKRRRTFAATCRQHRSVLPRLQSCQLPSFPPWLLWLSMATCFYYLLPLVCISIIAFLPLSSPTSSVCVSVCICVYQSIWVSQHFQLSCLWNSYNFGSPSLVEQWIGESGPLTAFHLPEKLGRWGKCNSQFSIFLLRLTAATCTEIWPHPPSEFNSIDWR